MTTHPFNIGWLDWESVIVETERQQAEQGYDYTAIADQVWADDDEPAEATE